MRKFKAMYLIVSLLLCTITTQAHQCALQKIDDHTYTTQLTLQAQENDLIYADFITVSVDNPKMQVERWVPDYTPNEHYLPHTQTHKKAFSRPVTITVYLHADGAFEPCSLHVGHIRSGSQTAQNYTCSLTYATPEQKTVSALAPTQTAPTRIEKAITSGRSLPIQLILLILLGLLVSLTPCIYPMIPITIGIMQGQGQQSFLRTFIHACAYAFGIATTFACIGLFVTISGGIFGSFLSSPIAIIGIVLFLLYMAGSVFGFYELYIPAFLRAGHIQGTGSSLISSFLLGAASGTVASPCLSPGLAFVLTLAAATGSKIIGFLFLFSFGIGLSIPLLVIAASSGSIGLLTPGPWMEEIKKAFGFLLVGMAFYYLKNILDLQLVYAIAALVSAALGYIYMHSISSYDSTGIRQTKNFITFLCFTAACVLAFYAYQSYQKPVTDTFWTHEYEPARMQAQKEGKLLFIDFWAPTCSICTALDKTLLQSEKVRTVLSAYVSVKINMDTSEQARTLQKKFTVRGLPTLLIVDPANEHVLKQFGAELYGINEQLFIEQLTLPMAKAGGFLLH